MIDLILVENNEGGDLYFGTNDLIQVDGWGNMIYIALFGGNVEQDTPTVRPENSQQFDWWGNSIVKEVAAQCNSSTERTLMNVALNSNGRVLIQQAVESDLEFMNKFCNVDILVSITGVDRVQIDIKVNQPENQQNKEFVFIWGGTRDDLSKNLPEFKQGSGISYWFINSTFKVGG